jgi:hypothetical protein
MGRYPPVKPEQQEALTKWFPTRTPAIGVEKLPKLMKAMEEKYGEKTWGVVGVSIPTVFYQLRN